MSFPNYITLSRIIAAPILWYLIYSGYKQAFAWLLTYAFFTDLIDGVIARKMRRVSALGSKLDSWGDSITILSGLAGLLVFEWELLKQYGVIVSVVFALHLLQLLLSLWRYKKAQQLSYMDCQNCCARNWYVYAYHFTFWLL